MMKLLEITPKQDAKHWVQPEPEPVDAPSDCQMIDGSNNQSDCSDSNSLFYQIGRDISIGCLIRCSRSEYGSLACLNHNFRSLIKGGKNWVYFCCNEPHKWVAYDPKGNQWMTPPLMPYDECSECTSKELEIAQNMPSECFGCAGKQSLAVGTELLVFSDIFQEKIELKYSILSNSWTHGKRMNQPRYNFASASLGEKAIVAGGFDEFDDNVLNSAELYNSDTGCWVTIPSMNKARSMCSGVFMDGKFYVVGGESSDDNILTCGEEYDLDKQSWRVIPNMVAGLTCVASKSPLFAVVRNELYKADYFEWVLKKYDKKSNVWLTLGPMPLKRELVRWFNMAICACGDMLLAINEFQAYYGGLIEIYSWVPDNDGPPQWNIITERDGITVSDCTVMGC